MSTVRYRQNIFSHTNVCYYQIRLMALQPNLLQQKRWLFSIEIRTIQIDQLFLHPNELNSDFNCLVNILIVQTPKLLKRCKWRRRLVATWKVIFQSKEKKFWEKLPYKVDIQQILTVKLMRINRWEAVKDGWDQKRYK